MNKHFGVLLLLLMLTLGPCSISAESTYPRLEELTNSEYEQNFGVFSMARTTEYTVAQAIANGEIPKADAGRLRAVLPEGMKGVVATEDGLITVTVNLADSDWTKVLSALDSFPYIGVFHTLDRPTEVYDHHVGFGGNGVPDEPYSRVQELIWSEVLWGEGDNTQAANGEMLCEIVPEQSLLLPGMDDESTNIIAWLDHETESCCYEYYKVKVIVQDVDAFHIPFRYVTKNSLSATKASDQPGGVSIKSIVDGDITFRTGRNAQANAECILTLEAPEGASAMKLNAGREYTVNNGLVQFTWKNRDPMDTHEETFAVTWYGSAGEVVDYGVFMLHSEPEEFAAWPYYEENWNAVPDERIKLINHAASVGVDFSYTSSTGDLHIGYNPDAAITGELGNVIARVKAPEGATYYRTNHSGGNDIMGRDTNAAITQINFTSTETLYPVPNDGWIEIMDYAPIRVVDLGPVELYLQIGEGDIWPYAGGVFSIFWYSSEEYAMDASKAPMRIEYVSDTMGALCVTSRFDVVDSEAAITNPVSNVTCVANPNHPQHKNWRLRIRRYPHRGDNAFHYELVMENEYGVYQPLDSTIIFYMPYPNGHYFDMENDCAVDGLGNKTTYEIYHYNNEYTDYDEVVATPCAYGIRFEVNSLSPFVIAWSSSQDEREPDLLNPDDDEGVIDVSDLPQTGDSSIPQLWLTMSILSLLGIVLLRKRYAQ